ncbi:MAG TPA: hypothetical protein VNB06_01595, partial [Thermoanaerobaculia bacterium]|nr:hypothetical protein [Thermoanaerobaculia bacterium]
MAKPLLVIAAVPLVLLLVLAPLPFGSVTEGWAAILAGGTFVAAALAVMAVPDLRRSRALLVPLVASVAMALLGLLQILAWPAGAVELLSPEHVGLFSGAAALANGGNAAVRPSLSLAREATLVTALYWVAVAGALLAAGAAAADRRARRAFGGAIVATALFEVLFGAQHWFAQATTIWGIDVPSD